MATRLSDHDGNGCCGESLVHSGSVWGPSPERLVSASAEACLPVAHGMLHPIQTCCSHKPRSRHCSEPWHAWRARNNMLLLHEELMPVAPTRAYFERGSLKTAEKTLHGLLL